MMHSNPVAHVARVRVDCENNEGTVGTAPPSENAEGYLVDCAVQVVDERDIPSIRRCHFAAVATAHSIYLLGGTTTGDRKTNCEQLLLGQPNHRQWKPWKRMNHASRAHCCAIVLHNRIHVLGGIGFTAVRPVCIESASFTDKSTHPRFDMNSTHGPDGRYCGSAAAALDHTIYFLGGFLAATGQYSQRVSMYDAVRRQWRQRNQMPDMPTKRAWCAATTLDDAIYVVGGTRSYSGHPSAALTMLSPKNRQPEWIELPPMTQGRDQCAAVTVGRYIVVLGGRSFDGANTIILDSIEAYEVDTAQWIPLPSLAQPRAGFAAVVLSSTEILVLGGYNHEGGHKTLVSTVERIRLEWGSSPSRRNTTTFCTEDHKHHVAATTTNVVDQWTRQVRQLTADCQASLEDTTRRITEAQQVIQSQNQVVHEERQRHEQTTARLHQTLQQLQRQVQEEAPPKEEASVSSDKYKTLLAAIAETHEVLLDLGRMRPLDSARTGATSGRQLQACHDDDDDEKDNATRSSRRASLRSFASTRCLLSQHHHNNNEASSSGGGLPPPPHELLCPITLEIMTDPVLTCDGMTYERRAIERYFWACQKHPVLSPKTGQILASQTLIPNIAIRNLCRDYEQECERQEYQT